jgi:isoquinoline 1-oxidoreductase beta subunit
VRLHNHLLRRFGMAEFDFILQAALIAKQSKDPVKMIWSREEDIQHDMYRPYYYDRISAGLDAEGRLIAEPSIAGSSVMAAVLPALVQGRHRTRRWDGAIDMLLDVPNKRVEFVREEPPGIPHGVLARRRPYAQCLRHRGLHRRAGGDRKKGCRRVSSRDARQ